MCQEGRIFCTTPRTGAVTPAERGKDNENCNSCGGPAKIIAYIEDPFVIENILGQLERTDPTATATHSPPSRDPPQVSLFG